MWSYVLGGFGVEGFGGGMVLIKVVSFVRVFLFHEIPFLSYLIILMPTWLEVLLVTNKTEISCPM